MRTSSSPQKPRTSQVYTKKLSSLFEQGRGDMTPDFSSKLASYQKMIEASWKQLKVPTGQNTMTEAFRHLLSQGGKRLRPILVLLAGDLYGQAPESLLLPALAVESFHNSTLVHDDIMDKAPLRRGITTIHEKWDEATAILIGDVYLTKTYALMSYVPSAVMAKCIRLFQDTVELIIQGQFMDLDFETREEVSLQEYLRMIEFKTSVLLAIALKLGALISSAPTQDQENLYQVGRYLGLAFQIQDDLLDTFGDPQLVGKAIGGDIRENKKTYLILKALEIAPSHTREKLNRLMAPDYPEPNRKVREVTKILAELKVDREAQKIKQHYFSHAMAHLEAVKVNAKRKQGIIALASSLLQRMY